MVESLVMIAVVVYRSTPRNTHTRGHTRTTQTRGRGTARLGAYGSRRNARDLEGLLPLWQLGHEGGLEDERASVLQHHRESTLGLDGIEHGAVQAQHALGSLLL